MRKYERAAHRAGAAALAFALSTPLSGAALSDTEADKAKLAQCAKDLCSIIVSKKAKGPDLDCDLTKTWEKDQIQRGAESKNLSWGLGSAKCTVKVQAKRSDLIAAFTASESTFRFGRQWVSCEIGADKYQISATMAPELKFKDGLAAGVALHMSDIQGALLIKGVVWTAAALEENFGILQGDLIREVNKFIKKECPKILAAPK
jgi:hypothetical protein